MAFLNWLRCLVGIHVHHRYVDPRVSLWWSCMRCGTTIPGKYVRRRW